MRFLYKVILAILCCSFYSSSSLEAQVDSISQDPSWAVLPATAYTPKTGFTIGAIIDYYFPLNKKKYNERLSSIRLGSIYTTRQQAYIGIETALFTPDLDYFLSSQVNYARFVDRDYGIGNDASARVIQFDFGEERFDTLNYLDFKYQSFGAEILGQKQIKDRLFVGVEYLFERIWDYEQVADSISIINQGFDTEFDPARIVESRSGFGVNMTYDTRDYVQNPLEGVFVDVKNLWYTPLLGSDFNYVSFSLDARYYLNTHSDKVLAMRIRNEQRYPIGDSYVPKYDLARVGGLDFMRGYFNGTYLDNHVLAFEVEYRIPLWVDYESSFWKFWKRIGVVVFGGASRVYPDWNTFHINRFRYSAGVGGRYLLSADQRVNARLDIGLGLDPNSNQGKPQLNIYLFISEAF